MASQLAGDALLERLAAQPGPVIVEVWAPWCGPCRAMAPALERVADEFVDRVPLWRINIDEDAAAAKVLRVLGIPTLIVFRNGVEVNRRTGQASHAELTDLFTWAHVGENNPPPRGLSRQLRMLRPVVGLAILLLGLFLGQPWLLVVAAVLLLSAVYDVRPLWHAARRTFGQPAPPPT